jgi:hypothetical protein
VYVCAGYLLLCFAFLASYVVACFRNSWAQLSWWVPYLFIIVSDYKVHCPLADSVAGSTAAQIRLHGRLTELSLADFSRNFGAFTLLRSHQICLHAPSRNHKHGTLVHMREEIIHRSLSCFFSVRVAGYIGSYKCLWAGSPR